MINRGDDGGMKDRIRQVRKMRGYTQGELGVAVGRSAMYISMIENGKSVPTPDRLAVLASALSGDETWLMNGSGPMTGCELTRDRRTIGERLCQVRKEKGMNQTVFAAVLGVTRLNISLLETGKISASPKIISTAVEKLGIDEDWLRTGERTPETAKRIISWLSDHDEDRRAVYNWLLFTSRI